MSNLTGFSNFVSIFQFYFEIFNTVTSYVSFFLYLMKAMYFAKVKTECIQYRSKIIFDFCFIPHLTILILYFSTRISKNEFCYIILHKK